LNGKERREEESHEAVSYREEILSLPRGEGKETEEKPGVSKHFQGGKRVVSNIQKKKIK